MLWFLREVRSLNGSKYTIDDIEKMLEAYADTENSMKAHELCGFPASTISDMAKREENQKRLRELRQLKKDNFDREFITRGMYAVMTAYDRLQRTLEDPAQKISGRDLAIIIGTIVDKMLLLMGQTAGDVVNGIVIIPERLKKGKKDE